jgi:hypothetical protein
MDQEAIEKVLGWVGIKGSKAKCAYEENWDGALSCTFEISPRLEFGILFSNGFSPIFYETEW